MSDKVKTLDEFKADKAKLEAQVEQTKRQLSLLLGASLYVTQEIANLEKPEEVKSDGGS